mgnify:CR=1 FL=1
MFTYILKQNFWLNLLISSMWFLTMCTIRTKKLVKWQVTYQMVNYIINHWYKTHSNTHLFHSKVFLCFHQMLSLETTMKRYLLVVKWLWNYCLKYGYKLCTVYLILMCACLNCQLNTWWKVLSVMESKTRLIHLCNFKWFTSTQVNVDTLKLWMCCLLNCWITREDLSYLSYIFISLEFVLFWF